MSQVLFLSVFQMRKLEQRLVTCPGSQSEEATEPGLEAPPRPPPNPTPRLAHRVYCLSIPASAHLRQHT